MHLSVHCEDIKILMFVHILEVATEVEKQKYKVLLERKMTSEYNKLEE